MTIRTGMLVTVGVAIFAFLVSKWDGAKWIEPVVDFFSNHDDRWWGGLSGWLFIWVLLIGTSVTFTIAAVGAWKGLLQ